ncbi:prolyl oligopeptidase family serine peptidase [Geofilum sp. OHC36d9]|uniref:prolyl oligopeptidase family serine peptidase n=1 Tax=Geofilum sp. OHC36d9 TaxID=3458413 RepID=UPI0040334E65
MKLIKQSCISVFLFLFVCNSNYSQEYIQVPYLNHTPNIDGVLDSELEQMQQHDFNYIWQFDNPPTDTVSVRYLIGYTPTHFYLYIETQADSINFRNRGFSNGDGFKLLFTIPQKDTLTDEFYELNFSPSKNKKYWARQKIWTFNIKTVLWNFSNQTLFEYSAQNGKCGFEALISWSDIPPYHPWMLDKIGFNLYFAKAIGDTITNGYAVVHDYGIWDEGVKRKFAPLQFEKPKSVDTSIILVQPKNRTIHLSEHLTIEISTISDKTQKEKISINVANDSSKIVIKKELTIKMGKQLTKESIDIETEGLNPRNYNVTVASSKNKISSTDFTIIPELSYNQIYNSISDNSNRLGIGIVNTLIFKLNLLRSELNEIKPYESGKDLLSRINSFMKEYEIFQKGTDPFTGITEPYRRAFKSKYDGFYQPYTIKLPNDYDSSKKYPLLVFLHGSGVNEQNLLNKQRSNGNFIELAPLARDMYNCFSSDSSQNDIIEAIEDVISNFSVDTSNIIIGGFSMGGYGALRTYYEHPDLYKGVAVFAGYPYLASNWLDGEHPNFLKKNYISKFIGKPVFIYHGKKDGSLPVDLIKKMSTELENVGAKVTLIISEDKGHEYPDKETNEKYFEWLDKVIGK